MEVKAAVEAGVGLIISGRSLIMKEFEEEIPWQQES